MRGHPRRSARRGPLALSCLFIINAQRKEVGHKSGPVVLEDPVSHRRVARPLLVHRGGEAAQLPAELVGRDVVVEPHEGDEPALHEVVASRVQELAE